MRLLQRWTFISNDAMIDPQLGCCRNNTASMNNRPGSSPGGETICYVRRWSRYKSRAGESIILFLVRCCAVAENYPALKADAQYIHLQTELRGWKMISPCPANITMPFSSLITTVFRSSRPIYLQLFTL